MRSLKFGRNNAHSALLSKEQTLFCGLRSSSIRCALLPIFVPFASLSVLQSLGFIESSFSSNITRLGSSPNFYVKCGWLGKKVWISQSICKWTGELLENIFRTLIHFTTIYHFHSLLYSRNLKHSRARKVTWSLSREKSEKARVYDSHQIQDQKPSTQSSSIWIAVQKSKEKSQKYIMSYEWKMERKKF